MNFPDIRTVMLNQLIMDAACTAVLAFLWWQNRKRHAGIFFWTVDFIFQTTAVLLVLLRGSIPDWMSLGVANPLVVAGAFMGYLGLNRFVGKKSSQVHNYVLLAVFSLVHIYFVYVHPDLSVRNLILSLGLLILCAQCAWLMLRHAGKRPTRQTLAIGWVFMLFCLFSILRVIIIFTNPVPSNDFFRSGLYDALILTAYQSLLIMLTVCLVEIVNQRLRMDVSTQEDKFTKVFQSSPNPILIGLPLDDGPILEVNHAFEKATGYSPSEVIGKTDFDLHLWVKESDRQKFIAELSAMGEVQGREFQFRMKSGEQRTGLIYSCIIVIQNERSILSSYVDITGRKLAEEQIRILSKIPDESPNPIMRTTPDGTLLYANRTSALLLAMWKTQVGQSLPDEWREKIKIVFDSGFYQEVEIRCEGKVFSLILAPIVDAGYINIYGRDITERKHAEGALQEREQQLMALVTSLDDIVIELDEQGTYLQTWTTDENLLALPKSQLLGKRLVGVLGEEIGSQFEDAVRRVLQSGKPENIEYPLEISASRHWFMARISPIVKSGSRPASAVALVRDITHRKLSDAKIKEQLDRLEALRELDQLTVSTFSLDLSLNELVARTVKLLAVDGADVLLLDPIQNALQFRMGVGSGTQINQNAHVGLGHSLAGKVVKERRIVQIQNLSRDDRNPILGDDLKEEGYVGYIGAPLIVKGKVIGVLEVFDRSVRERDQDWLNFFYLLAEQAAIMVDNVQLFNELQTSNLELTMAYDETIEGWSHAMDLRDEETEGHSRRVVEWTLRLARKLGFGEEDLIHIRRGALLHDIGKLGVPDIVLQKQGPLTEEEWDQMRQHPQFAYDMLAPITYLRKAIDIPYCHHEKWDGTGYPRGLKSEEIPLAARIFAVVDVWDALCSDRPYRKAWPREKTLAYIREQAGKQFDPNVAEIFLKEVVNIN